MSLYRFSKIIGLCLLLTTSLGTSPPITAGLPTDQLPSLAPMLEKTIPGVVAISGLKRIQMPSITLPNGAYPSSPRSGAISPFHDEEQILEQFGSGIIVDQDKGYILTNAHVVNELDEIRVYISNQSKYPAQLIGIDKASDLALLQIDAKDLQAVTFADSDSLKVGDFVIAIGSPYGFSQTVTSGIVSALGRSNFNFDGYFDFIQTDAALNSGNSGGGLFNLKGELVGLNTAIISPPNSGGNVGLGFAIPANMAKSILEQLVNDGHVNRGPLGVRVQNLTPDLALGFSVPQTTGAIVIDVIANTPADKTGLAIGDVITAVDGKAVKDATHLRNMISLIPIGNKAKISLIRSGKSLVKTATINDPLSMLTKGAQVFSGLAGARFENTPDEYPIRGVVLAHIEDGTHPVNLTELKEGDIIVGANQRQITNLRILKLAAELNKTMLVLQVKRDKTTFFVAVKAAEDS